MRKKVISILIILIIFYLQFVMLIPKVNAACHATLEGNDYTAEYNADKTKITSITVHFSYIDNVNIAGNSNNWKRQYNLIFTKDANKKRVTTNGQPRVRLNNLANRLGISDAIYSSASIVGQSGVTYTRKERSESNELCGTQITGGDSKYTLIQGTYTITDRAVLGKFEPNTTYYGLLCSGFSDGSSSWYTGVSIDVQINENKTFVILDENTKPTVTVTKNHKFAINGDVLTTDTNADEVTYNWYYDDDEDGVPDDGSLLGTGVTYTVKCPDVDNPDHDDTGHKIICVVVQNKDKDGAQLSEEQKPKQITKTIYVRGKAKDISSTAKVTNKGTESFIYDGKQKKPTIVVKDGEESLIEGQDYDIQYVGIAPTTYGPSATIPTEIGKYKAIIKFKECYTGEDKVIEFSIIEKGSINVTEQKISNAENANLSENKDELINKIDFTDEELSALEKGKNISIYLDVKDISDSVSKSDKEKIDAKLNKEQKIGIYLDVNLFKKVEGQEATKITKTNGKIKISFEIPEKLINTDPNINRTITVLKLHEGVVSELDVEINGTTGTFETDEFSTYALTYKDEKIPTSKNPKTGDTIINWVISMIISIIGLFGTFKFTIKNN